MKNVRSIPAAVVVAACALLPACTNGKVAQYRPGASPYNGGGIGGCSYSRLRNSSALTHNTQHIQLQEQRAPRHYRRKRPIRHSAPRQRAYPAIPTTPVAPKARNEPILPNEPETDWAEQRRKALEALKY